MDIWFKLFIICETYFICLYRVLFIEWIFFKTHLIFWLFDIFYLFQVWRILLFRLFQKRMNKRLFDFVFIDNYGLDLHANTLKLFMRFFLPFLSPLIHLKNFKIILKMTGTSASLSRNLILSRFNHPWKSFNIYLFISNFVYVNILFFWFCHFIYLIWII